MTMGKHCMIAVMTMLVVLGLVYEIGEQGIRYQVKPLYKVYEEDGEMKERIEETKELLFEEEKIVNWYVAGNSKWNYGE